MRNQYPGVLQKYQNPCVHWIFCLGHQALVKATVALAKT